MLVFSKSVSKYKIRPKPAESYALHLSVRAAAHLDEPPLFVWVFMVVGILMVFRGADQTRFIQ